MQQRHPRDDNANFWLDQIFSAKAAAKGGVVRRNADWVAAEIGRDRFIADVRARGWHLLETGNQLIVICHRGPIRKLV